MFEPEGDTGAEKGCVAGRPGRVKGCRPPPTSPRAHAPRHAGGSEVPGRPPPVPGALAWPSRPGDPVPPVLPASVSHEAKGPGCRPAGTSAPGPQDGGGSRAPPRGPRLGGPPPDARPPAGTLPVPALASLAPGNRAWEDRVTSGREQNSTARRRLRAGTSSPLEGWPVSKGARRRLAETENARERR